MESKGVKYTKQQYEFVCSLIWGSIPVDRNWAEMSALFITRAPQLLHQYPQLDKSFYEENKDVFVAYKECVVIDTWKNDKVVHRGTYKDCQKYLLGSNVYQSNYSKLKLLKIPWRHG